MDASTLPAEARTLSVVETRPAPAEFDGTTVPIGEQRAWRGRLVECVADGGLPGCPRCVLGGECPYDMGMLVRRPQGPCDAAERVDGVAVHFVDTGWTC